MQTDGAPSCTSPDSVDRMALDEVGVLRRDRRREPQVPIIDARDYRNFSRVGDLLPFQAKSIDL
jgi:hypothetical protein